MGSVGEDVYGVFRYNEPDPAYPAEDRALYSFPKAKQVKDEHEKLHDFRTSTEVVHGPAGIDVQGFTFLKHKSALSGEDWFKGTNVEDIYRPEMIDLILKTTGAKRAVVDGFGIRGRTATEEEEKQDHVHLRGSPIDQMASKLPRDKIRVPGKDRSSKLMPARMIHVDYTVKGLKDTVRFCRTDIKDVAQPSLDAEDAGKKPRYAAYSIWRPLKQIKRDPLAVLDWRTVDKSEVVPESSRVLSGITESGEYLRETLYPKPSKNPEAHRWYWIPNQEPDDVIILKFADTAADDLGEGTDIAAHTIHGSPVVPGTENEEPRESIECRIIAFFD